MVMSPASSTRFHGLIACALLTHACGRQQPAAVADFEVTVAAPQPHAAVAPALDAPPPEPAIAPPLPPPPPAPPNGRQPARMKGPKAVRCAMPRGIPEEVKTTTVTVVVGVDATGKPTDVAVIDDPGNGFAQPARVCILKRHFEPGLDDSGLLAATSTLPIVLQFSR
jgi:hypothetical protein